MSKTRRTRQTRVKNAKRVARVKKLTRVRRFTRVKGGGPSCYKADKDGKIVRTWSCTTECGENGECLPFD
jgi:hypothetical protein